MHLEGPSSQKFGAAVGLEGSCSCLDCMCGDLFLRRLVGVGGCWELVLAVESRGTGIHAWQGSVTCKQVRIPIRQSEFVFFSPIL